MSSRSILVRNSNVDEYIRHILPKKISRELSYEKFSIVSEADLQAVAYVYLKKYLSKDKRYKIYNKIYLTRPGRSKGVFPDIVILRTMALPRIALEFKEHKTLQEKYVMSDVKKLFKFKKMYHGYLIYLTREEDVTGDRLTGKAEEIMGKKYLKKITPIVINVFDGMKQNNIDNWKKKWEKYSKLRIKKDK